MSTRTLLVPAPLTVGDLLLDGDEAHHARAVLRLEAGDEIRLADGAGRSARAVLVEVGKRGIRLAVDAPEIASDGPAALLTIAVAPPKGDRFGDLVRGLTELGVGAILPLATERGERMPASLDRIQRIAGEALKQCRRAHLPRLGPQTDIPALVRSGAALTVLDRSGMPAAPGTPRPLTLVIGPEGGFTDAELATLRQAGAATVRLAASAVWSAAWIEGTA